MEKKAERIKEIVIKQGSFIPEMFSIYFKTSDDEMIELNKKLELIKVNNKYQVEIEEEKYTNKEVVYVNRDNLIFESNQNNKKLLKNQLETNQNGIIYVKNKNSDNISDTYEVGQKIKKKIILSKKPKNYSVDTLENYKHTTVDDSVIESIKKVNSISQKLVLFQSLLVTGQLFGKLNDALEKDKNFALKDPISKTAIIERILSNIRLAIYKDPTLFDSMKPKVKELLESEVISKDEIEFLHGLTKSETPIEDLLKAEVDSSFEISKDLIKKYYHYFTASRVYGVDPEYFDAIRKLEKDKSLFLLAAPIDIVQEKSQAIGKHKDRLFGDYGDWNNPSIANSDEIYATYIKNPKNFSYANYIFDIPKSNTNDVAQIYPNIVRNSLTYAVMENLEEFKKFMNSIVATEGKLKTENTKSVPAMAIIIKEEYKTDEIKKAISEILKKHNSNLLYSGIATKNGKNTIVMLDADSYTRPETDLKNNTNAAVKIPFIDEVEDIDKKLVEVSLHMSGKITPKNFKLVDIYSNNLKGLGINIFIYNQYSKIAKTENLIQYIKDIPLQTIKEELEYKSAISQIESYTPKKIFELISLGSNISYTDKAFPDIANYNSSNLYSAKDILENPILWNFYASVSVFKNILEQIAKKQEIPLPKFSLKAFSMSNPEKNRYEEHEKDPVLDKKMMGIIQYKYYPLLFELKTEKDIEALARLWAKTVARDEEEYEYGLKKAKETLKQFDNLSYLVKKTKIEYNYQKEAIINKDILVLADENFIDLKILPIDVYKFYETLQKEKIFNIEDMTKEIEPKNKTKINMAAAMNSFLASIYTESTVNDLKNIYIEVQKSIKKEFPELKEKRFDEVFYPAIKALLIGNDDDKVAKRIKELLNIEAKNTISYSLAKKISHNYRQVQPDSYYKYLIKYYIGFQKFKELNAYLKEYKQIVETQDTSRTPKIFKEYKNILSSILKDVMGLKQHQIDEALGFNILNYENLKNSELLYWEMRTGKTRTYIAMALLNNIFKNGNSLFFIQNKNYDDILQQAHDMLPHITEEYIDIVGKQDTVKNKKITYDMPTPFTEDIFPNIPVKISKYLKNPTDQPLSPKEILAKDFMYVYKSFFDDVSKNAQQAKQMLDKNNPFYPMLNPSKAIFGAREDKQVHRNRMACYFYLNYLVNEGFLPNDKKTAKEIIAKLEPFFELLNENIKKAKENRRKQKIIFIGKNAIDNYAGSIEEDSNILTRSDKKYVLKKLFSKVNVNVHKVQDLHGEMYMQALGTLLNRLKIPSEYTDMAEQGRLAIPMYEKSPIKGSNITVGKFFYQNPASEISFELESFLKKLTSFEELKSYYEALPADFYEKNKVLYKEFEKNILQVINRNNILSLIIRLEQELKEDINNNGYNENNMYELKTGFKVDYDNKPSFITTSLPDSPKVRQYDDAVDRLLDDFEKKILDVANEYENEKKEALVRYISDAKNYMKEQFGSKGIFKKLNEAFYLKAIEIFYKNDSSLRKNYELVFGNKSNSLNLSNKVFEKIELDLEIDPKKGNGFVLSPRNKALSGTAANLNIYKYSVFSKVFKKMIPASPLKFKIHIDSKHIIQAELESCFFQEKGKLFLYKRPMINPKEQLNMPFIWNFSNKEKRSIKNLMVDEIHKNANIKSASGVKTKAIFSEIGKNKNVSLVGGTGTGFINAANYGGQISLFTSNMGKFIQNINKYCLVKEFKTPEMTRFFLSYERNSSFRNEFEKFIKEHIRDIAKESAKYDSDSIMTFSSVIMSSLGNKLSDMIIEVANKEAISTVELPSAKYIAEIISKIMLSKKSVQKSILSDKYPDKVFLSQLSNIYLDREYAKRSPGFTNPFGFASLFNQLNDTNISIKRTHDSIRYNILDLKEGKSINRYQSEKQKRLRASYHKDNAMLAAEAMLSKYSSALHLPELKTTLTKTFNIIESVIFQNIKEFKIKSPEEFHKIFTKKAKQSNDAMINHYENYLYDKTLEFRDDKQREMFKISLKLMDIYFGALDKILKKFSTAAKLNQKEFEIELPFNGKMLTASIKTEDFADINYVYGVSRDLKFRQNSVTSYLPFYDIKNGKPIYCYKQEKIQAPVIFAKNIRYRHANNLFDTEGLVRALPEIEFSYNLANQMEKEILEGLAHSSHTENLVKDALSKNENVRIATTRNVLTKNAVLLAAAAAYKANTGNRIHIVVNVTEPSLKELVGAIDKNVLESKNINIIATDTNNINNVFSRLKQEVAKPISERKELIVVVGNYESLAEGFAMEFIDKGIYYGAPQSIAAFIQSAARQIGHGKYNSDFYLFNGGNLGLIRVERIGKIDEFIQDMPKLFNTVSLEDTDMAIDIQNTYKVKMTMKDSFIAKNNLTKYEYLKSYESYMSGKLEYEDKFLMGYNYWNDVEDKLKPSKLEEEEIGRGVKPTK